MGVGKTTLGRALATRIGARFIDCDELADPSKDWVAEVFTVSQKLVFGAIKALKANPIVIVARPLRARDWTFFRERFRALGVTTYCITLTASAVAILGPARGRVFDAGEKDRVHQMIAEGYGTRPFSDLIVETDRHSFAETVAQLVEGCHRLVGPLNAKKMP
jgi:hypothetical protein